MCVFCDIVSGKIPVHKVFETEEVLAVLDINPTAPGHILVMPKPHAANMEEISEELLNQVIAGVKKAPLSLMERST